MSRNGSFRKLSGCLALLLLLTGCEQESAEEYVSYQSLEQSGAANGALDNASGPTQPAAEPTPADQDDGDPPVEPPAVTGAVVNGANAADVSTSETQDRSSRPVGSTGNDDSEAATAQAPGKVSDGATDPASGTAELAEPREIKLLVKNRQFQIEGPQGANRVSFDDIDLLKILNMEPVPVDAAEYLPDWLVALEGKRVRIRGFMYPTFEETGIKRFLLARDNQICCFGRDPKVYDLIRIRLREGAETNYIEGRPFDVVGIFHIRPDVFDDQLDGLYAIEDAVVLDR